MDNTMGISRRSFLKGALTAGAGAAAFAAMPGCSPKQKSAPSESASSNSAATGQHTWDVAPEPITDIAETRDFDVVIVGGGMAGTGAAQAAARNGATVAVIERNAEGRFCGLDMAAMGSKVLKDAGVEINIDDAVRLMYAASQQTANYQLIRTWAEQAGPVIDYITELCADYNVTVEPSIGGTSKAGWTDMPEKYVVFQDAVRYSHNEYGVFDRPDKKEPHQNLGDVLVEDSQKNGAEFFFNTHAEQLVGSAADGVTGVIAKDADGKYIQFNASRGVIMATGDIAGNQEMIDVWAPICNRADSNAYTPAGSNTGDAILMGRWIGAGISKSPAAPMVHQFIIDTRAYTMTAFMVTMLAVNTDGKRFMNEMPFEPYITDARMNARENKAWSVFDSNYAEALKLQWPDGYEGLLETVPAEIEERLDNGTLVTGETLEELASAIGVDPETFVSTVDEYNAACEAGTDAQFGVVKRFLNPVKEGPFYASPVYASTLAVAYGLHVDENSQVCTDEDEPIAGLFAAGNCQGDFFGMNYPVHCPGCSTGRSLVYGQLLGEALANDTVITDMLANR